MKHKVHSYLALFMAEDNIFLVCITFHLFALRCPNKVKHYSCHRQHEQEHTLHLTHFGYKFSSSGMNKILQQGKNIPVIIKQNHTHRKWDSFGMTHKKVKGKFYDSVPRFYTKFN